GFVAKFALRRHVLLVLHFAEIMRGLRLPEQTEDPRPRPKSVVLGRLPLPPVVQQVAPGEPLTADATTPGTGITVKHCHGPLRRAPTLCKLDGALRTSARPRNLLLMLLIGRVVRQGLGGQRTTGRQDDQEGQRPRKTTNQTASFAAIEQG